MSKISKSGEFTKEDFYAWSRNIFYFTLPLFLSTFFAQLSLGSSVKDALAVSTLVLWGAIADYFKKKGASTRY